MAQPFILWGQRGWAGSDVVGESHYVDHIKSLLPPGSDDDSELELIADLVPEPANPFDSNAVAVRCAGGTVGYLPREDAARYSVRLAALVDQGLVPQVTARIWGGMRTDYDFDGDDATERTTFVGSVRLDLPEPHLIAPVNEPPLKPYVLLPPGNSIRVGGDKSPISTVVALLPSEGEAWAHVTLDEHEDQTTRTPKRVVRVMLNEDHIGTLTPRMSAEVAPAIRLITSLGAVPVARAMLSGNRLQTKISVYVLRANQLSSTWIDSLSDEVIRPDAAARRTLPSEGSDRMPPEMAADFNRPATGAWAFRPAPGWPTPPPGWTPSPGWRPDPSWPAPPPNWQFWVRPVNTGYGIDPVPAM